MDVCMYMYVCMYVCMYMYVCTCMYVCMYVCTLYVCTCMYVCMYVSVYLSIYMFLVNMFIYSSNTQLEGVQIRYNIVSPGQIISCLLYENKLNQF